MLQADWDPGGSIPDLGGVVRLPKRCDITDPGPVMVSPTAEMCVCISESFLCCVRLAGPTFGVRIVANNQYGQGSTFDLWTMCLFGLDAMQVQLGNPVAVKEVQNIGNIKLWDCWLSCWGKLCMDGRNRMELIGQYPDTAGGHRPPGRAVLSSCSDEVNNIGGVLLLVVSFTLYICGVSVN